jgi:MoaA/NifB/PqqE/SkfB family radical SAM enzyme
VNLGALGRITLGAARYRLTGRRAPLTAFVSITNRCEASCTTCIMPYREQREVTSRQLHALIDGLADRGCQAIVLTGGEPLGRRDLPEMIQHCTARGLWVRVDTNGYRYPSVAQDLRPDHLVVSLDGDEAAHDRIREPGAYVLARAALAAAVAVRAEQPMLISTRTVLTRHNLDTLDHVLDVCESLRITADFELLNHNPAWDGGASPELAPTPAEVRRSLRGLLDARRRGRPVRTTAKTLRTLLAWEDYSRPNSPYPTEDQVCLAGQTHLFVDADGSLYPCRQRVGAVPGASVLAAGFDEAFSRLQRNDCQSCAASDLCEQNLVNNLNVPTLLGVAANHHVLG